MSMKGIEIANPTKVNTTRGSVYIIYKYTNKIHRTSFK